MVPLSQTEVNRNASEYYKEMTFIYELIWGKKDDLSLHCGFWEEGTKNQQEANLNENLRVAEALDLQRSDIVLDAGCGVCGPAVYLSKKYGCKITGITIAETQITRAKKYIQEKNIGNLVNVELRDFCNSGFSDEAFTKIYAIESSCYALNKAYYAKEIFRMLKPQGRFALVDGFLNTWDMDTKIKQKYEDFCRGFAVPSGITIEEFKKCLEDAGFIDIKIEDKTSQILPGMKYLYIINNILYIPIKVLYILKLIPKYIYLDTVTNCSLYHMYRDRHFLHVLISAKKP